MLERRRLLRRIRACLLVFVLGLVLAGLTAFPLEWEVAVLHRMLAGSFLAVLWPDLLAWIGFVHAGLVETGQRYPFMAYGTDWLAFAHLVIAVAFIGPWRDPVRNVWVIEFGLIACLLVVPLALVFGPLRGIPWFWRAIDCSVGLLGAIPLALCWRLTRSLSASSLRA